MRSVSRPICPAILNGPDSVGGREHAAAELFFEDPENAGRSYKDFNAYKDAAVAKVLREMFGTKCCYCESQVAHTGPADVEHYRPKAGYVDDTGTLRRPGYWWLAADWDNLLLSCIDCNRNRRHTDEDENQTLSGKQNHFPLQDERMRARVPGDEHLEQPLLLNPCTDRVEDYFEYVDEGVIRPVVASGLAHARSAATIEILGLDRPMLSKRRGDRMKRVDAAIEGYRLARAFFEKDPTDATKVWVTREIQELKRLWGDDDEFSHMVRQRVTRACPEAVLDTGSSA